MLISREWCSLLTQMFCNDCSRINCYWQCSNIEQKRETRLVEDKDRRIWLEDEKRKTWRRSEKPEREARAAKSRTHYRNIGSGTSQYHLYAGKPTTILSTNNHSPKPYTKWYFFKVYISMVRVRVTIRVRLSFWWLLIINY